MRVSAASLIVLTGLMFSNLGHSSDCIRLTHLLQLGDVGPTSILSPHDIVYAGSTYTPIATAANFGDDTVGAFPFVCFIDTAGAPGPIYADTQMVSGLAGGDTITKYFFPWTIPQAGIWYYMTAFTDYEGDTLRQNDTLSGYPMWSPPVGIAEVLGETPTLRTIQLLQNYPNPFSQETAISFKIPLPRRDGEGLATNMTLKVYDLAGRLVKTLVDRKEKMGYCSICWDGSNERGQPIASGVYFYRLKVPGFVATKRLILLR